MVCVTHTIFTTTEATVTAAKKMVVVEKIFSGFETKSVNTHPFKYLNRIAGEFVYLRT